VDPAVDEGLVVRPFTLGDFVFVMGKDQVLAAAMDIEGVAEIFSTHRRALDMPARSARTPGAVPGRFARLRPLPQDEVHRVSFLLVDRNPRPGLHVVEVAVGELAVPGKLLTA